MQRHRLGNDMSHRCPIDPYVAKLKQSERKAFGYGFLALFLLVIAFLMAGSSNVSGQFSPLVEQVRYAVGMILLCGSGVSILVAIWFIGQYMYVLKWPQRFE
jgi:hypothetical protein